MKYIKVGALFMILGVPLIYFVWPMMTYIYVDGYTS